MKPGTTADKISFKYQWIKYTITCKIAIVPLIYCEQGAYTELKYPEHQWTFLEACHDGPTSRGSSSNSIGELQK